MIVYRKSRAFPDEVSELYWDDARLWIVELGESISEMLALRSMLAEKHEIYYLKTRVPGDSNACVWAKWFFGAQPADRGACGTRRSGACGFADYLLVKKKGDGGF